MTVAGFTSTGSKRPEALYGLLRAGVPTRMVSSQGCSITASDGREYLDCIMGLGAVALGYAHPEVNAAAIDAVQRGVIGALAPIEEEALAADLASAMPHLEQVRFLKTGAEAVAAAIRLARVATNRDRVLSCGYHGWLDWCSRGAGVPRDTQANHDTIPFNDGERALDAIRSARYTLAGVIIEPVVERAPDPAWLKLLREETERVGALLVFDEVKTAFRVGSGGAAARWGVTPDLTVIGKAIANGFPLAAVGGASRVMRHVVDTWISSTTATEYVSLAAARAAIAVLGREEVSRHLRSMGARLYGGLEQVAAAHPDVVAGVLGVPEMCALRFFDEETGGWVAASCAERGLLWKRNAYNFVSLAHAETHVDRAIETLHDVLRTRPG